MKTDTHPTTNLVCFEDLNTGKRFLSTSTMTSDKKDTINGEEYYVVSCSITSDSHPFYTERSVWLIPLAGLISSISATRTSAGLVRSK